MENRYRLRTRQMAGFVLLGVGLVCGAARADSIYLKNGSVIRTASAIEQDGRVVFLQYGHPMAIPLAQVQRIEHDEATGPPATPPRSEKRDAGSSGRPEPTAAEVSGDGDSRQAGEDPRDTRGYWQDRVGTITGERQGLELELLQLRRIERAFLFSHRSTADTRRQIEDVEGRIAANEKALPELRREARRLGVPPGWLRLRRGG